MSRLFFLRRASRRGGARTQISLGGWNLLALESSRPTQARGKVPPTGSGGYREGLAHASSIPTVRSKFCRINVLKRNRRITRPLLVS